MGQIHGPSFLAAPGLTFSYNPQLGSSSNFMRKLRIGLALGSLFFTRACSPRDFLTRRLASDLIASPTRSRARKSSDSGLASFRIKIIFLPNIWFRTSWLDYRLGRPLSARGGSRSLLAGRADSDRR